MCVLFCFGMKEYTQVGGRIQWVQRKAILFTREDSKKIGTQTHQDSNQEKREKLCLAQIWIDGFQNALRSKALKILRILMQF